MTAKRANTTRGVSLTSAQRVATSGTSAQSSVFGVDEILVFSTQDCWIAVGSNPTAAADTAGNIYLLAGEKLYLQVDPTSKLAAIQSTTAGAVHIVPTTLRA